MLKDQAHSISIALDYWLIALWLLSSTHHCIHVRLNRVSAQHILVVIDNHNAMVCCGLLVVVYLNHNIESWSNVDKHVIQALDNYSTITRQLLQPSSSTED